MRCIYLLTENLDPRVQSLRQLYDPLAELIQPHITLVFPFHSSMTDKMLIDHVEDVTASVHRFNATVKPAVEAGDGCIYLPLGDGANLVRELHDKLYTGPLVTFLIEKSYIPHITVANVESKQMSDIYLKVAGSSIQPRFLVSAVILERIGNRGHSIHIAEFPLKKAELRQ